MKTPDDARTYIADRSPGRGEHPAHGVYIAALNATREQLGICTLFKRPHLEAPDLGFAFLPAFRLLGYALESSRALKDYAHNRAGIARLLAIVRPDNVSSVKLLERLGFRPERSMRDEQDIELIVYAADAA